MAIKLEPGELTVRLHNGKDLKDCDWFGKQDPYVILKCGGIKYRSNTHALGGRNPVWNQAFAFKIDQETELELEVWDEDKGKTDDCIGKGKVELVSVRHAPSKQQTLEVPLHTRISKRQQGHVHLTLNFLPTPNRSASFAASASSSVAPVPYAAAAGPASMPRPSDGSLGPSYAPVEDRPSLPGGIVPAGGAPDKVPQYEPSCGLIQPQPHQMLPCHQPQTQAQAQPMQPAHAGGPVPPPQAGSAYPGGPPPAYPGAPAMQPAMSFPGAHPPAQQAPPAYPGAPPAWNGAASAHFAPPLHPGAAPPPHYGAPPPAYGYAPPYPVTPAAAPPQPGYAPPPAAYGGQPYGAAPAYGAPPYGAPSFGAPYGQYAPPPAGYPQYQGY